MSTTNLDIINERITAVLVECLGKGLLTDIQFRILSTDIPGIVDGSVEEEEASKEAIEWNIVTSI